MAEIKEIQLTGEDYEDGSRIEATGVLKVSPETPEYSQSEIYMELTPADAPEETPVSEE